MSLVFVEHIGVFKNYTLNCHYETKHTEKDFLLRFTP